MSKKWLGIILCLIIINSCITCSQQNEKIIQKEKLISILIDIHIADGMLNVRKNDLQIKFKNKQLYESVYRKHGISREKLNNTIDFYSNTPDELNEIYDEIIDKLKEAQQEINKEEAELRNLSDSLRSSKKKNIKEYRKNNE